MPMLAAPCHCRLYATLRYDAIAPRCLRRKMQRECRDATAAALLRATFEWRAKIDERRERLWQ